MTGTNVRAWPISQACRDQSARLGCDPFNPSQLIATPNEEAHALNALLTSGSTASSKGKSRFLVGLVLGVGLMLHSDSAQADFPEFVPSPPTQPLTKTYEPVFLDQDPFPAKPRSDRPIELFYLPPWELYPLPPKQSKAQSEPQSEPESEAMKEEEAPVSQAAAALNKPQTEAFEPVSATDEPAIPIQMPSIEPTQIPSTPSWLSVVTPTNLESLARCFALITLSLIAFLTWRELSLFRQHRCRPPVAPSEIEKPMKDDANEAEPTPEIPNRSSWIIEAGGASHRGLVRSENQDDCRVQVVAPGIALAVTCDGVGGRPGGRTAARYCTRKLASRITMGLAVGLTAEQALLDALAICPGAMAEDGIEGLTTALITIVEEDRLTWAGLGDGRITVIHPDGMGQDLMAPHHCPSLPSNIITAHLEAGRTFTPRLGSLHLDPNSLVFTLSDGAGDIVNLKQLATRYAKIQDHVLTKGAADFCEQWLNSLERLVDPKSKQGSLLHSDNLTVTLLMNKPQGETL